ncbi:integrase catalytic domain-containing protein [Trichonephila clavipes]|nr:integrase catalytic domain-containing protein [Trichonephila clavipes]
MAQHRPRKPAPVEYSTDEEDMIVYDVEENEIESNPDYDINELDSTELKIRKNRFDVIGEELKTLFDKLFSLARDDEIEGYILEKQELLDTWEEMLILLERRVSHLNKTNKSAEVIHTRNSDSTEIKLPTLSLPTFSGVIDEWKSACKSTNKCRKCGKSQYTLLHFMTPSEPNSSIPRDANNLVLSAKVFHSVVFDATNTDTGPNPPNVNNPSITSCSGYDSNSQVLLCTALVNVCDSFGGTRLCRVLLDPGSQACLITSSCLERLGLPRKRTNVRISCLGASDTELMVFRRLSLHLILHLIFRL